ncbi:hypothetical protein HBH53_065120 [Parastagonospora nodorum]|nr:hypothetical protein HBH53_065120 [Parastagonospora nodorum]KAH4048932.1 hypothetical protein HBH49_153170 [Parastagonospora nodorum]KAH4852122.1 hypothetical protein HBH75_116980 [Parastagonospora nodorum]KAH5102270.1 hypothetical protein HBH72_087600 [Parastagonospora nodorum]KAH5267163.1 hypothetical protein HBI72_083290 [Parastagonospora nodorum]
MLKPLSPSLSPTTPQEIERRRTWLSTIQANSGHHVDPPATLSTLPQGTLRGRVIATYFGVLPEGFEDVLAGAVGTEADRRWVKDHYKKIQAYICTERYGSGSFLQRWLRGNLATLSSKLWNTNWAIEVSALSILPAAETPQEQEVRIANRDIYQTALDDLHALWRNTYSEAFEMAVERVIMTNGQERIRWERAREMYRGIKDAPPAADVDINILRSRAQCDGAKVVPFYYRPKDQRLAVFRSFCTKDILASHLEASRSVVDIRRLARTESVQIPPASGQESIRREFLLVDPSLQSAAATAWRGIKRKARNSDDTGRRARPAAR